jgi:hypothetical protein
LALRAIQVRHPLFQALTVNCIGATIFLPYAVTVAARRKWTWRAGVCRRVKGDPDCGVPPVRPVAYMPFADLVSRRKCGQARREATHAEYSVFDWKGHFALDLV